MKPSLNDEIGRFKAIVRHITRHETTREQATWFRMESRMNLKRLAKLGVEGHQPAVAAFVKMTCQERRQVTRSIMLQKVGNNPKAMKAYDEHSVRLENERMSKEVERMRNEERVVVGDGDHDEAERRSRTVENESGSGESVLVKLNRIAGGTTVRWKRHFAAEREGEGEVEAQTSDDDKQRYMSRLLNCTRCNAQQETRKMQLRTKEGYRAVHCKACGRQERSMHNLCQCGVVWHQCATHRIDPPIHTSRKGVKRAKQKQETKGLELSSRRAAPNSEAQDRQGGRKKRRLGRTDFITDAHLARHVKVEASRNLPKDSMIQRIRNKCKLKKEEEQARRNKGEMRRVADDSCTASMLGSSRAAGLTQTSLVVVFEKRKGCFPPSRSAHQEMRRASLIELLRAKAAEQSRRAKEKQAEIKVMHEASKNSMNSKVQPTNGEGGRQGTYDEVSSRRVAASRVSRRVSRLHEKEAFGRLLRLKRD